MIPQRTPAAPLNERRCIYRQGERETSCHAAVVIKADQALRPVGEPRSDEPGHDIVPHLGIGTNDQYAASAMGDQARAEISVVLVIDQRQLNGLPDSGDDIADGQPRKKRLVVNAERKSLVALYDSNPMSLPRGGFRLKVKERGKRSMQVVRNGESDNGFMAAERAIPGRSYLRPLRVGVRRLEAKMARTNYLIKTKSMKSIRQILVVSISAVDPDAVWWNWCAMRGLNDRRI